MKTIYYHANIVTMDNSQPKATAIAIENGSIIAVGNDAEILALKEATDIAVDLDGKTMLPGFIDAHSHFSGMANSLSQCDLSEAKSFDDIVRLMKEFIEKEKPDQGEWIFGSNYDHNFLQEKKHPDKSVLNQISTTYPIVIVHASSHMGVANDVALASQNITDDIKDPIGGRYGRLNGTNKLSGYMEENAFIEFQKNAPMISKERLLKLMEKAQDIYASYGITTVQDGMVNDTVLQLLQYASSQNILKLDVVGYIDLVNCRETLHKNIAYTKDYISHLKIGGYKMFLDGSPQGKTAWISQPYQGSQDDCGYPIHSDEETESLICQALQEGRQLLAHCNGDQAAEQYISAFERVKQVHPEWNTHRPVMIHAQLVRADQLKRMVPLNMMPSFFVAHTYFWGDIHIENFGYERASRISPAGSAVRLKIPFTFHQDSPVLQPDMMKSVACAILRKTRTGVALDQKEAITITEALKAITVYAAYQYHEEDSKGSISVGKKADLVILDQDPYSQPIQELENVEVLMTLKEGQIVFKR